MAALRKKFNSRYWIACFTDQNGVQRQKSTKELNRARAQKIAEKLESSYRVQIDPADAPERLKARRLIGHRPTYVYEVLAYWTTYRDRLVAD